MIQANLDRLTIWMKLNGIPGEIYHAPTVALKEESFRSLAYDVSGRAPYRWRLPKGPATDKKFVRFFPNFEQLEAQVLLAIEFKKGESSDFWRLFEVS